MKSLNRGLTLVELLIALAVLSILSFIAIPGLSSFIEKQRAETAMRQMAGLVRMARNEAVATRHPTTLCPSVDGRQCSSNWNRGVLLFTDDNQNSEVDTGDKVVRYLPEFLEQGDLSWRSLRNKVQFDIRGLPRGTVGSFVYCPASKDQTIARSLVINFQGRIRPGRDSNGDGIRETGSHKNISC